MKRLSSASLCMIAKNEEIFLGTALRSAKSIFSLRDIVVVDTGSTDKTKDIALEFGAAVFDFKWCDDFSAARNFAASKAKNDWIFVLDADEEVMEADIVELEDCFADNHTVGSVTRIELSDKATSNESRLYNRNNYRYEYSIHEQITPLGHLQKVVQAVPILIAHHGYISEFGRVEEKLRRNERLLKNELSKHPDDPYLLHQLGKSFFCDDRDLPQALACFEKALSLSPDSRLGYVYDMVECYGYTLLGTGQYEKALELMNDYAPRYGSNPRFRFLSAHIYQNNGMLVEAAECYESCIGADIADYMGITSFLSYYNIGVILECIGMVGDAIEMYERCGDYQPAKNRLSELCKT
ncbi:MAG: glycosyltransferase [Oscillospiraceae bacterium]|nr:glycosyltransferase [Oscillospiraceae bacterium]